MASSASTEPATPAAATGRATADLMDRVGALNLSDLQETAWIEVIRKMEEVYSDLIRYEVDLERKNAALEQAQRFIESVLASMSDVLIICDSRARIQQVNRALLDLTGHEESELLGQPFATLLPFTDRNLVECFAELTAKGTLRDHEARFMSRLGEPTDPVALNCSLRRDGKGQPAGYVIIGRPVGELRRAYEALNAAHADLKAAQQQLVQSEKMASLGRLIAGVAHELNNPASFVLGNSHALERYAEKMAAYLSAIHGGALPKAREKLRQELGIDALLADLAPLIEGTREGAERVADIVKNLRRFSFTNPGGQAPFDLAEVVRTAAQWASRGRKRAVPVDLSLPGEGLTLRGHAGSIHQVMVNLVQNALDAVEEMQSPRIEVAIRQEGRHAVVTVTDNGPGIPSEHLLKVFDPFFTTKPVGRGTGLGLWISYTIIKDHGGAIEAGNRLDGGAAVIFTLPL
jgi:two-component system sensor histidine kinase HupT/HoxJ